MHSARIASQEQRFASYNCSRSRNSPTDNLFQGILLRGEESVKGYREVLSKIHYFNTRPDTYSKRIYTVQCAMLKGRVLSNELVVTVSFIPLHSPPQLGSFCSICGFAHSYLRPLYDCY